MTKTHDPKDVTIEFAGFKFRGLGSFFVPIIPDDQRDLVKAALTSNHHVVDGDDPVEFTPVSGKVLDDLAHRLGLQRHVGETDEELCKRIAYVGGDR